MSVVQANEAKGAAIASARTGAETSKDNKEIAELIKPAVKNADMTPELQGFAISAVSQAFDAVYKEKDIAAFIREKFDKEQGPTWNVIVGRMYGADVTHETKKYIQLLVGELTIIIWKSA